MKYRDLARRLVALGWWQVPNRGPHEKWTNGKEVRAVPRDKEINEFTAISVIRFRREESAGGEEMRLEGLLWKDKKAKYWVAYVPLLEISTQGTSKKNALAMIEDAIRLEADAPGFRAHAELMKEGGWFAVSSNDPDALVAFMLRRQRTSHGLTLREVARRLKSSSPSAYAQYEQGKRTPSLGKLRALLQAIDPKLEPILKAS